MKVLGITGGVGSGKSEILKYLKEEYGAAVCQMDETARELQRKGTECFRKIAEAFGSGIVGGDGELDRRKLGARVFSDPQELRRLNSIVHQLWYIYVPENVRRERLKASRQYTDGKITDMIASQPSEEAFREACTAVIDNGGPFENTQRQIGEKLRL